jgi:hypothetical protein
MAKQLVPLIGSILFSWFCGVSSPPPPPPPPAVSVTLTPSSGTLHINTSLQFTATVHNSANTAVVWSLSGGGCSGATCGTISDTGLYTAPASLPAPPSVTVKVTSVSDSTKSASATVLLLDPIMITVRPPEILVTAGLVRRFGALVENAIDDRVTWTLSGSTGFGPEYGTISEEGLYTAPDVVPADPVVTITATSVEDPAVSGSTTATIGPSGANEVIWTWVSGSDTANALGVYGTKGVPAPANVPGARGAASSWIDPGGNLWLFGGFGQAYSGPTFNDLWKFNPAMSEWTWVSGSDAGAQSGVFGTKGVADPLNVPGSKSFAMSWCDPGGKFWLMGGSGCDALGQTGPMNDLWSFDPATGLWTYVSGFYLRHEFGRYGTKGVPDASNVPGARSEGATWIDANGRLWLFGGYGFDRMGWLDRLNDLWMFDPVTSEWTWISGSDLAGDPGEYGTKGVPSPSNRPGCRSNTVTWVDLSGRLWLFGGYDFFYESYYFGDLWCFDPADGQWTWVSGSDWPDMAGFYGIQGVTDPRNVPGSRYLSRSWTGSDGRLWLFGGEGFYSESGFGTLNDLWRYDPAANEWTWVAGSDAADQPGNYATKNIPDLSNLPGGRYYALSWLDAGGRFWLWGGGGVDSVKDEGNLNDLWYFMLLTTSLAMDRSQAGPRRLQ